MTQTYAQRTPETTSVGPAPQRDLSAGPGPMPSFLGAADPIDPPAGGGPSLEERMSARMEAHFGTPVIQMKRSGEPAGPQSGGSVDQIISSLEERSGVDLSDVEVHRNSPRPAELGALAYAQGDQVYLGPGQDRHLSHELTHVVQQKQGMVHPTGTLDGMPVNTSPALEQAADTMQVSAAPETASAGPGVIQGVFVDPTGKRVGKQDLAGMKKMLTGSLDSMILEIQSKSMTPEEKKRSIKALTAARKKLGKRLNKAQKSKQQFSAADELTSVVDDAIASIGLNGADKDSFDMMRVVGLGFGSKSSTRAFFNQDQAFKNTGAALQQSMSTFQLPTTAAAGIDSIGEYDPSDEMTELEAGRMGNSSTLANTDTSPEAQAKRERSMQQFRDGAAVARQGAAAMKEDPDNISFSSLMDLFSGINTQVRGGGDDAGKLRGKKVAVGQLAPPSAAALPEDAYRTFAMIADKMKEIKANPDPKLAKTQAVHLAAFAYQTTISEHMFADGNGRTCRLFADSILQTFGLPPSTPVKELSKVGANIGDTMDFQAGADAILSGVQQSDQTLKASRPQQPPAPASQPAAPFTPGEKTSAQRMAYRSDEVGAMANNIDVLSSPDASDPQALTVALRRMYDLIKNPPPDETPERASMRKREFARLRALQIDKEAAQAQAPAPQKKRGFFSRLFGRK